jgi:hypothetical protein
VIAMIACGCDEHGRGGGPGLRDGEMGVPSGRVCDFAETNDPTSVGSPSLDCPSRMCVHVQTFSQDQCAADCEMDEDCIAAPESPCSNNFVCTAVTSVGPFACRKLCVCGDRAPVTGCP